MSCQFSIRDIHTAIVGKLTNVASVATNCYNANQVKLAARDGGDLPKFSGDRDVIVAYSRPFPTEDFHCGSGRLASQMVRYVDVVIRTRAQSGIGDRDDNAILNTDLGHLLSEEFVLDALHLVELFDGSNQRLLTEPMRVSDGPSVYSGLPEQRIIENKIEPPYTQSAFTFEIKYLPVMS